MEITNLQMEINDIKEHLYNLSEEIKTRALKEEAAMNNARISVAEANIGAIMEETQWLSNKTEPKEIINDFQKEFKRLAEYDKLGYGTAENILYTIKKKDEEYKKLETSRIEAVGDGLTLSRYIDTLEKTFLPIEYIKTEILDLINNYDENTSGVAMSEAGNSRFFYILALSSLMNIIIRREKELNG